MHDYKRLNSTTVEIYVPENQRVKTDENVLLSKKIIFGLFLILFAYTASHSFLKNISIDELEKDADMFDSPGGLNAIIEQLKALQGVIILTVLIALGLSALTLVLFRFFVGFIVWLMIDLLIALLVVISIGCFIVSANDRSNETPVGPIIVSLLTVLFVIFVVAMRKFIALAIELLREAAKAVICMSKLVAVPFITSVAVFLVTALFVVFVVVIDTASQSTPQVAFTTHVYNMLVYSWFVQFVMDCQHMIVAGAVGKWFFTRNKTNLGDPVLGSAKNLWNFHLGTVAFGSLVILTIRFVRSMVKFLKKIFKRCCCCCYVCCCCCLPGDCCGSLAHFLEYLSYSSYIITSIFGLTFVEAGKKAFELIMKHAVKILTVQVLVKLVMFVGKVFVVGVTIAIFSHLLDDQVQPEIYLLVGIFAYIVVQGFFDTYEMAVDTVIIGFCADCEVNDGLSKPYYMSVELVAFLEKAKVFDNNIEAVPI